MIAVYCVANLVNGKCYVGKTAKEYQQRWKAHLHLAKKGRNTYFYRAIRKYGAEQFSVVILRICHDDVEANTWEKYFIKFFRSHDPAFGYNGTFGGDGGVPNAETVEKLRAGQLGRKHTQEHIAKCVATRVGRKHSPEWNENIQRGQLKPEVRAAKSARHRGRKVSEETRNRQSVALKGRIITKEAREKLRTANLGKKASLETRAKMSASRIGMKQSEETKQKKLAAYWRWYHATH